MPFKKSLFQTALERPLTQEEIDAEMLELAQIREKHRKEFREKFPEAAEKARFTGPSLAKAAETRRLTKQEIDARMCEIEALRKKHAAEFRQQFPREAEELAFARDGLIGLDLHHSPLAFFFAVGKTTHCDFTAFYLKLKADENRVCRPSDNEDHSSPPLTPKL